MAALPAIHSNARLRPVRILSRYLVETYLIFFAAVLCASMLIIVIVEMLLNLDQIFQAQRGLGGIVRYLTLRIPAYYLRDLLPLASFAAAFLTSGLAARWHEVIAMKVGGISPQRAVVPLLCASLVLSLFAAAVNETLVVRASQAWSRYERGGDGQIDYRRGWFWYHRGRVIYNIREADRDTQTLRDVNVFELNDQGRLVRSIHAESVQVESSNRWRLREAVIRSFDPSHPEVPRALERTPESLLEVADERDLALLDADASALSILDLREYIELRAREGADTTRYRAQLHWRLAAPVSVALFAFLGIPIGLRVERTRSLASPALQGILLVASFYLVRNLAATLAASGLAPAGPTPWLVLAAFGGAGTWLFGRVPR